MAKAKPKPQTLDVPPFPPLTWDEYSWVGELTLPSWADFQSRGGAYGARSSRKRSDGTTRLRVAVDDSELEEDAPRPPPSAAQAAAMRYLLDNEARVAEAVLGAIFEQYPENRANYGDDYDLSEAELNKRLPELSDPSELKKLMGLSNVHVLYVESAKLAYIGFEFGCFWEAEHGAGVMTHRSRVAAIGHADTSFLEWIAEDDAKKHKRKKRKK